MPHVVLHELLHGSAMNDKDISSCLQPNEAYANGLNEFGFEASALSNSALMGAKPPGISSMLDPATCNH